MTILFVGGNVYNSTAKKFEKADVLTKDGIITDIIKDGRKTEADKTVDLTGKYVIPGFVDVHTHGRGGFDFNTADEDGIKKMRESYAKMGTTTIMATLASSPLEELYSSAKKINNNRIPTPGMTTIGGIHLEGRYLSASKRGAHAEELLHKPDAEEISGLLETMMPCPVHVSAALEEADDDFYKAVLGKGGTLGIAHSNATYDEATDAVNKGAVSFTHTFNAMRQIHHREPGNAAASMLEDRAYSEIICDGMHVHPAIIELMRRAKPDNKLVLITDSMEAAGCDDGEYAIAGQKVFVKDGKALNIEGALAGSTLDLFTALKNYMKFCSQTLEEAVPMATSNPADMVGLKDCGRIEIGKRGDFVVLTEKDNPEISAVYTCAERV